MAQQTSSAIHFLGSVRAKKEAKGYKCDTCTENFYGLASSACKACDCYMTGSQAGTICDAETGQIIGKSNAGGRQCNQCVEGSFGPPQKDSFLLWPCNCEKTGTVDGSLSRDKSTGPCPCKAVVTGLCCSQCEPHRCNLTMGSLQGCQVCECDSLGTIPGSICDPVSGHCLCRPHWQGRRCEQCQPVGDQLLFSAVTTGDPFVSGQRVYLQHHHCAYVVLTELLTCLRLSCVCNCCLWGNRSYFQTEASLKLTRVHF